MTDRNCDMCWESGTREDRLHHIGTHRGRLRALFFAYCLCGLGTLLVLTVSDRLPLLSTLVPHQQLLGGRPPLPRAKALSERDVYLCAIFRGRVGNAFFNYMSVLGVARANNMTLLIKDDSVLSQVLQNPPRPAADFQQRCADALYVPQRHCAAFDERLMRLPHDDHFIVYSCFISWRYFAAFSWAEVKSILAFRQDVKERADVIVRDVRRKAGVNVTVVGMHVRRGDQSGWYAYWQGHNPVTPEYTARAMRFFTDRFHPLHFLVASDDTAWCRRHVQGTRSDVTIMEGNTAAVDIATLTLTDHMIVSIGTFGWWAGYLNPGVKTYMKNFVSANSDFSHSFDDLNATGYVYPGWVGL